MYLRCPCVYVYLQGCGHWCVHLCACGGPRLTASIVFDTYPSDSLDRASDANPSPLTWAISLASLLQGYPTPASPSKTTITDGQHTHSAFTWVLASKLQPSHFCGKCSTVEPFSQPLVGEKLFCLFCFKDRISLCNPGYPVLPLAI